MTSELERSTSRRPSMSVLLVHVVLFAVLDKIECFHYEYTYTLAGKLDKYSAQIIVIVIGYKTREPF